MSNRNLSCVVVVLSVIIVLIGLIILGIDGRRPTKEEDDNPCNKIPLSIHPPPGAVPGCS